MRKLNILLADDNKHFIQALKFMLQESNSQRIESIREAHDGSEAINIIKNNCIDLVFMDIDMPGINGIEATKQATEINRYLTVIALSFHQEMEFVTKMLEAGARNYIIKEDICTQILNKVLDQDIEI